MKRPLPFLDRALALVSPRWAMQRVRSRLALEVIARHYEGAALGRRTAKWKAPSTAATSAALPGLQRLRDRSRDLARNNPWAKRGLNVVKTNTVGTGIEPKAVLGASSALSNATAVWKDWGATTACDADGRHNFYGLQALAMHTAAESGEALVRRRRRRTSDSLPVPIQLQVLEGDFLDDTKDRIDPKGNRIIGGVQYNAFGRREGYWLFDEHPGEIQIGASRTSSSLVPASEIQHVYAGDRPGQRGGVPWLAAAVIRLRELDEFEDASLLRQKIAACFAAFRQDSEMPEEPADVDTGEGGDKDIETLEPGTIEDLPPGKTMVFSNPPTVSDFEPFTRAHLRAVAAALGITYEALTGDYSMVNFSSGRMGWLEMARNVDDWRWNMLHPQLLEPSWGWFTDAGEIAGWSTAGVRASWTAPRREMIDPVKETNARKAQVRSGFLSLSEAQRQDGYDPEELMAELAEDLERARELGLVLDVDGTATKPAGAGGGSEPSAGA